ncbi:hypothetical protein KsCSTR_43530 [Candidatus Kuenenia stuttgartiensis]|uniref:Uncharacterized protein n=1 Tax=Kuenenia stuttgartiensis TaxID=174633 RepID=A0A6G7GWK2_KUEST|nr:hypothetical protein KsCSTR_43530 [Candidatus Kuenenia stuttgartiensis]
MLNLFADSAAKRKSEILSTKYETGRFYGHSKRTHLMVLVLNI